MGALPPRPGKASAPATEVLARLALALLRQGPPRGRQEAPRQKETRKNQENQEHQENPTNQDKRDKYVFVLTVDEQEMGRVEVNSLRKKTLRNLTDVKIFIGPPDPVPYGQDPVQDGSIKELIVLDRF